MMQKNPTASWKQPTKIHGRPTFLQLRKLEKELTANASKVQSELGGGAHGHLGMIKSAAQYTAIAPGTPYVFPPQPPQLAIPQNTSQHQIFTMQQQHFLETEKYRSAVEVRKALGEHLQDAIDSEYMAEFVNEDTNMVNQEIHTVLETLYRRYGKVRRQDLKTVERDVENMRYELTQPLTTVWKAIDELKALSKAARLPYSDEQLLDIALTIIKIRTILKLDYPFGWTNQMQTKRTLT